MSPVGRPEDRWDSLWRMAGGVRGHGSGRRWNSPEMRGKRVFVGAHGVEWWVSKGH